MATEKGPATTEYLDQPQISVEAGFSARLLVAPGTLYDPLFPIAGAGDDIWLNDDGGEENEGGGGIYSIARAGTVKALVEVGRIPPPTAIDRAPTSFPPYSGHIFALAQPQKGWAGATANHIILRLDPNSWEPVKFAELPSAGSRNKGIAGAGIDMMFGPDGGPFAGRLFAITALNNAIYEILPNGQARAFVVMDTARPRQPVCLTFARVDGEERMIVSTANGNFSPRRQVPGFATVTQITADGRVLPQYLVENLDTPSGLGFAPAGFGPYGGNLFLADIGGIMPMPAPRDKAPPRRGRILRVTADGKAIPFASGFATPLGLRFIGQRLIVCDINGDYIGGGIELADGFVVEITRASQ
jgi:hypothetical protein